MIAKSVLLLALIAKDPAWRREAQAGRVYRCELRRRARQERFH